MLIAQCNGYRIMTPSAFRLVPFKPHFHAAILPASGHEISWGNEGHPVRLVGSCDSKETAVWQQYHFETLGVVKVIRFNNNYGSLQIYDVLMGSNSYNGKKKIMNTIGIQPSEQ